MQRSAVCVAESDLAHNTLPIATWAVKRCAERERKSLAMAGKATVADSNVIPSIFIQVDDVGAVHSSRCAGLAPKCKGRSSTCHTEAWEACVEIEHTHKSVNI